MSKRIALVIGVGHYNHNDSLQHCPSSAQDVYDLLVNPDIGGCNPEQSELLLVTNENEPLTEQDVSASVTRIIGKLEIGDQFVFFFSGHATVNTDDELFLLLPNSRRGGIRCIESYDLLHMSRKLKAQEVNKAVIIVDACHSEAMFNSLKNLQGDKTKWAPCALPSGIGFMASCKRIQYSRQSDDHERTFFSYHFCEGLRHWPDHQSEYITLTKLKKYINEQLENVNQEVQTLIREGNGELWIARNSSYSKK